MNIVTWNISMEQKFKILVIDESSSIETNPHLSVSQNLLISKYSILFALMMKWLVIFILKQSASVYVSEFIPKYVI